VPHVRSCDHILSSRGRRTGSTARTVPAGYRGYAEVEIFNQEIWDAPPDDTAATVRQRFGELPG
jgi:phosphohistidine phosphatase SixA